MKAMGSYHRGRRSQRGQILVLAALMSVVLFGLAAVAFDLSLAMSDRRDLQAEADYAALAGAPAYATSAAAAHWVTMQYLQKGLGFVLPQGSCTGSGACPAGTYTIGKYTITIADPGSSQMDLSISHQEPSIFASLIGAGIVTTGSSARAMAPQAPRCALCLLNATAAPGLSDSGSGGVNVTGGNIVIDSTVSPAITTTGSGSVTAPIIGVVGGSGCTHCTPAATTGVAPAADPIGSALPAPPVLPHQADVIDSGSSSMVATPGVYSNITTTGSGSITLQPGVYIITGSMGNSGSGGIAGTGVTVYFECANASAPYWQACTAPGQAGGSLALTASGSTQIVAPISGTLQGLAIAYDQYNNSGFSLSGSGGTPVIGTVYAPDAPLTISGSGSCTLDSVVIVASAAMSGSGSLNVSYNPSQNFAAANQSGTLGLSR